MRFIKPASLLIAMIVVLVVTVALAYSPLGGLLGFRPVGIYSLLVLVMITILYVAASEIAKHTAEVPHCRLGVHLVPSQWHT